MTPQARSAAAQATKPEASAEGKQEPKGVVYETAEGRESLQDSLKEMRDAVTNSLETTNRRFNEMSQRLDANSTTMDGISRRLGHLENEATKPSTGETVKEAGEKVGNFFTRTWNQAKGLRHPNADHLTGAIAVNLAEYGLLVTSAQLWPVQIGNIVTAALFL